LLPVLLDINFILFSCSPAFPALWSPWQHLMVPSLLCCNSGF
jgi:hypothetical protein